MIVSVEAPLVVRELLAAAARTRVVNLRLNAPGRAPGPDDLPVPEHAAAAAVAEEIRRLSVSRSERVLGVVAVSDSRLALAAELNSLLGTPGASPAATMLAANKVAMRDRLFGRAGPIVRWRRVHKTADALALVREIGGPVVVKPAAGTGSRRIHRVDCNDEAVLMALAADLPHEPAWIAEELVVGPEFSVETLSWDGHHQVLGLTRKLVGKRFVEVGHGFPAEVDEATTREVCALVTHTLEVLGFNYTLGHTEVILGDSGPRIVETHPRLGGDRIGRLVELVTGTHPVTVLAAKLANIDPPGVASTFGGAAIHFLTSPEGIVHDVTGVEEARSIAGIEEVRLTRGVGDVAELVRSSDDRAGHVLAVGSNAATAEATAAEAAGRVCIVTAGP